MRAGADTCDTQKGARGRERPSAHNDAPVRHLMSGERKIAMITPNPLTPIKAIRAKCLDCCAEQRKEVHLCHLTDCSLHPYRLGRRPTFPATTGELAASFARSDDADDKLVLPRGGPEKRAAG